MTDEPKLTRRSLLAAATTAAGALVYDKFSHANAQVAPATRTQAPAVPLDPTSAPGGPTTTVSARSPFEAPARTPAGIISGSATTPIHRFTGTVTPGDLVFERHHAGVAMIDPQRYKLLVHGLVDRPMVFTLDELHRLPSVSRIYFLECSGNGRTAYQNPKPDLTPQAIDGLTSNGEWTGVSLATLLREVGAQRGATWFLAEGGDAAKLTRSIPIEKAWDDAMIAYAFNGEPLRPANGYPARLFLPGFEGNTSVKWLRRIKLIDQPSMSREETSKYTDALPNGTARQFSFVMDVKSIITQPAHPVRISRGWNEIRGLAWSGRGKIARVDVSTDRGATWTAAALQDPVLSKAHTRFRLPWQWDGKPTTLMSRAVDETGATQPTLAVFEPRRGKGTDYHFNYIRRWAVDAQGAVTYESGA